VVLALGVPLYLVAPTKWKPHFSLGSDKEKARALALRLWPTSVHFGRKKDHNRAEAALLARYGAEVLIGGAA
jgi:crossover junction endodeoxyribonuclease RuvC